MEKGDLSRVYDKLDEIKHTVSEEMSRLQVIDAKLDGMISVIQKHENILNGTSETRFQGLTHQVDKLTETDTRRTKQLWVVWVALLSGAVAYVAEAFSAWHK